MMDRFEMMAANSEQIVYGAMGAEKGRLRSVPWFFGENERGLHERTEPAQARKAREVSVGGGHLRLLLHRQSREVRVRRQIPSRP